MTEPSKPLSSPNAQDGWILVAAIANNGVIGRGDALPWRLSSDLKRFKRLTMGQCLLMGRKTYESIGRPLPGRQTIILSRQGIEQDAPDLSVASSLQSVESQVQSGRQVMVVGGADVYRSALPYCSQMWITRVMAEPDGDTCFPSMDWSQWQLLSSEPLPAGPADDWPTVFETWQRAV